MLELIPKTNIDFVGKRYIFFALSGILLAAGISSLIFKKGPRWGIDFTGGTLVEVKFTNPPPVENIRKALAEKKLSSVEIQTVPDQGIFIIRSQAKTKNNIAEQDDIGKLIQNSLEESFKEQSPILLRKEFVGPTVGRHLIRQTSAAFLLTFVGIIIYTAFRFHSGIWGMGGVLAIIHDVLATIGLFSLLNKEITVTIVAALLTIAGYSINDTIVVFDFMRERLRFRKNESLYELINQSINTTLSRTIITNLTVFLVVLTLYFFGGEVIHDFAVAMIFGAIIGTYSTIGIATPLIYEWVEVRSKKNKPFK
ncbi:MAG: protein-export membrane protein SecF [Elusimicrobia bacterium RIFCSPLOWO2_02_FULL_39_32]|nr:MAG: protein-export membrane protein SecF [Elusimicrobia bacterium GWA2_38_7]OGR79632.1 MAG: protein-export membrane protein SecF [Elusimicrobia bacterium RIFCSPHIGHO2_02_FULL_39_36]OGR92959.1 MAG: protein-export membrane protein SecF [Elusimicrobia bacterium RIFCSPLOWO2_02_FULL_39_32]OGR99742.1 MAG: protein-export membrane protein SecF [Elusimicrobia bacterium RIFCSPLOWO2_12_FULL_39_28]